MQKKQEIFDQFSVYENLCLEIEKILDDTYEISEKYYRFINSATNIMICFMKLKKF